MISGFRHILIANFVVLTALNIVSCKKPIKTREELINYVNDPANGLKKTEEIGKIKVSLTCKPWQLMQINQQTPNAKSQHSKFFKPADKLFFALSLSTNNKELLRQLPFAQYSEMVQVLAFRLGTFIKAYPSNLNEVDPVECIFQQTYGMGIANNVLIVFNKERLLKADDLIIKIKEFGLNTGNLNFEFHTKDIIDLQNIAIK